MIRIFATGSLLFFAVSAGAQEFGIELNAGMQGVQYKVDQASPKIQMGGSLGLNYLFPFGKRWGLLTGLSGGYYHTKTTISNGALFSSNEVDGTGSAFRYNAKANGYEETNSFYSAGIPIMLQYHSLGKTQWYLNAGTKILIPFGVKTKASAQQLELSGYYPDFNIEIDNLPQHGFGVLTNWSDKAEPEFKPTATLSAASGFSFLIGNGLRLYTGLYLDYGLTDIRKDKDPNNGFVTYSATDVNAAKASGVMPLADNARLFGYGIQLRLGFSKKNASPKPEPVPVVAVPIPQPQPQPEPRQPVAPVQEKSPEPVVAPIKVQEPIPTITKAEEAIVQGPVVFAVLGKTSVPDGLTSHLDSVANILQQYPDLHVQVIGHTCDIGSDKENEKIGLERARSVAKYLESKGVAAERIQTSTVGASEPIVPNNSKQNRSLNRRVTIKVE